MIGAVYANRKSIDQCIRPCSYGARHNAKHSVSSDMNVRATRKSTAQGVLEIQIAAE